MSSVIVDAASVGSVTLQVPLEKNDETGCQYTLSAGAVATGTEACWRTWEGDGAAAQLLVRMRSLVAQSAALEVYGGFF